MKFCGMTIQMKPLWHNGYAKEVSFEWSYHRISSADFKSSTRVIIHSGNEEIINTSFCCRSTGLCQWPILAGTLHFVF